MNIKNFRLKGAILIEPKTYKDDRGFFSEVYNQDDFSKIIGKKVIIIIIRGFLIVFFILIKKLYCQN